MKPELPGNRKAAALTILASLATAAVSLGSGTADAARKVTVKLSGQIVQGNLFFYSHAYNPQFSRTGRFKVQPKGGPKRRMLPTRYGPSWKMRKGRKK